MRDPSVNVVKEKRVKDAVEDAVRRLRPLLDARLYRGKARSCPIVNWVDPTHNHPKDEFDAAIELVDAVLSDLDADIPLGPIARIAREAAIPVLRRGRPPTRKKDSSRSQKKNSSPRKVLRDRWIAAVVDQICSRYGFDPTRNEATKDKGDRECGCSIVAIALAELKIPLAEDYITETIWKRNRSQT